MEIKVQGHGLDITEPLRDYAHKKLGKLEEFFDNIQEVEITLDTRKIKNQQRSQVCEITVWTAGKTIRAAEGASDMYAAIDIVLEKIERQIKKHKEKIKTESRKHADKKKRAMQSQDTEQL